MGLGIQGMCLLVVVVGTSGSHAHSHSTYHCPHTCEHGTCTHSGNNYYYCHCNVGWTGSQCDTAASLNLCPHTCKHGTCSHSGNHNYYCYCYYGWTGSQCDTVATYDPCHSNCQHGSCSQSENNYYYCRCDVGWTGIHCQTAALLDHCPHICKHGTCSHTVNHVYYCRCNAGWTGSQCDTADSSLLCLSHCQHGTCSHHEDNYYCHCDAGWTGMYCDAGTHAVTTASRTTERPTTTPTTSTPPTTTPTTTEIPTTHVPTPLLTCDKFSTLAMMFSETTTANNKATTCPSGSHVSLEAFVLNNCNVTLPSTWMAGQKVMTSCSTIPLYTPVATFASGRYSSQGGVAGIFVGCQANGFTLALQRCDTTPRLEHFVTGGIYSSDPNVYYTIM